MAKTTATRTRRSSEADAQGASTPDPVTAPIPTAEANDDARWEQAQVMRKAGTLQGHLIAAVRAHATKKITEDEDLRWTAVQAMSDAEIWEIVQWCDFERGAVGQVARALNKLGGVQ